MDTKREVEFIEKINKKFDPADLEQTFIAIDTRGQIWTINKLDNKAMPTVHLCEMPLNLREELINEYINNVLSIETFCVSSKK